MRFLCAAALLCLAAGCGGGGGEGGDSPEDVFAKIKSSFESGDYDVTFRCMAPDGRDGMLFGMMIVLGFSTMGDEDATTEVENILKKHGAKVDEDEDEEEGIDLGDEAKMKEAVAKIFKDVKNKPALFKDLMKALEKHSDESESPVPKDAELKDVKIEGDTATGTISSEDGEEEAEFVKQNGRWYAKFD